MSKLSGRAALWCGRDICGQRQRRQTEQALSPSAPLVEAFRHVRLENLAHPPATRAKLIPYRDPAWARVSISVALNPFQ